MTNINTEESKTKPTTTNQADAYTLDGAALDNAKRETRGRYQPLKLNAYREPLLKSLEDAFHAVMVGDLNQTKMVRFNHRSQCWELRFGIGKRCVRLETEDTSATEDLEFYNIKDLLAALQELHKRTKRGDYDEALNKKLKQRQEHAYNMLSKRKSVGFKLLEAPKTSIVNNVADTTASKEETSNDLKELGNSDHSHEDLDEDEALEAAE